MKYLTLGLFLMLFTLTACSEETTTSDALINQAELTSFEKSLADLTGKYALIYDIDLKNDKATEITGIVDYYENGEFVRKISEVSAPITEENNTDTIRVAFIQQLINDSEENWITSFMTDEGQSSGTNKNKIDQLDQMSSGYVGLSKDSLFIGKKKGLATIVYTNKDELAISNNIETEEDIKRATNYEHVYIISIQVR